MKNIFESVKLVSMRTKGTNLIGLGKVEINNFSLG